MNPLKLTLFGGVTLLSLAIAHSQESPSPSPSVQPGGVARTPLPRWRGNDTGLEHMNPEIVTYLGQNHCNALRLHVDVDLSKRFLPADRQVVPTKEAPLAPYEDDLKILDTILPVCRQYGIQIILAGGDIYGRKTDVLWQNTVEASNVRQHIIDFWSAISLRYRDEPVIVAYDIKNEPTYKSGKASSWWDDTLPKCIRAIRQNDRTVWIVVEPYIAFADDFKDMPLVNDPRVIYSFHHYWPHGYTHQGVRFLQGRYKDNTRGRWTYPGNAPRVEGPDSDHQEQPYWDKDAVRRTMQPVIDFQKRNPGVRILAGEFGVIRWAPNGARWLKDTIDLFEEQGWDWTFHAVGEWNGWDPTYAPGDALHNRPDFLAGLKDTDRLEVLKSAWDLNVTPTPKKQ